MQPENLTRLSPRKLRAFQRQLLAAFAPTADPEFLEAVRLKFNQGDTGAMRLYAEMRNYITKGAGVSVTTNVNNDNSQKTVVAAGGGFDQIVRALAEKRRLGGLNPVTIEAQDTKVLTETE